MGEDWCCGKHLFECFKSRSALIGEVPNCTLSGKACEGYGDFRVSVNEMLVEVGKTEKQLNVFNLSRFFFQSWIIWILYSAMVRPLGDSIYPRYSQELGVFGVPPEPGPCVQTYYQSR